MTFGSLRSLERTYTAEQNKARHDNTRRRSRRTTCLAVQHETGHSNTPAVRILRGRRFFLQREQRPFSTTLRSLKTLTTLGSLRSLENPHRRAKQGLARQSAQAQQKNHMPRRTARNRITQHACRPRNMRTAVFLHKGGQAPLNDFNVLKDFNDIRVIKVIRESRKIAPSAERT